MFEYVNSRSVSAIDPLGLEWTVNRNGEAWAKAIPDSRDDTIADLADLVQLNVEEAGAWLRGGVPFMPLPDPDQPLGDHYCDLPSFEVPNHVFLYTSKLNSLRAQASLMVDVMESSGFKVTRHLNQTSRAVFVSMWSGDGVYKIFAAGHGNESGFGYNNSDTINSLAVRPPYKLAAIGMFYCYSSAQHSDNAGPIGNDLRSSYWRDHVSRLGIFIGIEGLYYVGTPLQGVHSDGSPWGPRR